MQYKVENKTVDIFNKAVQWGNYLCVVEWLCIGLKVG